MMKQEMITQLIKELFNSLTELHDEYSDNEISYVIDAKKDNNVINIAITLNENQDKKEFEKFVDSLDDDLYEEVIESLQGQIKNLSDIYDHTNDYDKVIDVFKNRVREIAQKKINYLKTLV